MRRCFAIKGTICYSQGAQTLKTCERGYLLCEEGVCRGVFETLPAAYAGCAVRDYGDALILPGLVDLHTHAPQFSFRTLGMDLELLDWLNTHTFPEEAKYENIDYADRAYTMFVEDIKKGPNTRACIYATTHVPATLLLMDKLEASGLVTMVGKVNIDRNSTPELQEKSAARSLADTEKWLSAVAGRYRNTTPILTPRFIPSCTDALMRGLQDIQQRTGLPVQSHLSENKNEIDWVRALCPTSKFYGDAYDAFGLFGGDAKTVMAHCCWSGEDEMRLMRRRGVYVAHCPQSNMNISSGIAPIRRFLQNGLRIGLGSDVAGGCHASIFRAMSDAVQVSKLHWRLVNADEPALTLAEAFYLATCGGGALFGKVGKFEDGYEFDAIVLDDKALAAPFPLTAEERLARVVYLSDDRQMVAKYVRGISILD